MLSPMLPYNNYYIHVSRQFNRTSGNIFFDLLIRTHFPRVLTRYYLAFRCVYRVKRNGHVGDRNDKRQHSITSVNKRVLFCTPIIARAVYSYIKGSIRISSSFFFFFM